MSELQETDLISSNVLLDRTGISRATLNNYIKMGIIPPPIVRKPDDPSIKAKRIGFFNKSALRTIEKIKLYKKKGYPMNKIVSLLFLKTNESSEDLFPNIQEKDLEVFSKETGDEEISLASLSVLVANLQDSSRICDELPPEEYFNLIHQIRNSMEDSLKKYHGIILKQNGENMICYFPMITNSNYLMNTIRYAVEIRENLLKLSNKWKIRKGWINDLFMNIGINEGIVYFKSVPDVPAFEFSAFGDSVNHARRLSEIGCNGSIWITKNLMIRLNKEEQNKIRFGIQQKQQDRKILIENVYSRIINLVPPETLKSDKLMEIAMLSVTEILNLR